MLIISTTVESNGFISNIFEYTNGNEIEVTVSSADFEKAFDSIEHSFLFAVLKDFGFGTDFIQWIRTFPKRLMSNGNSSRRSSEKTNASKGPSFSISLHSCARNIACSDQE